MKPTRSDHLSDAQLEGMGFSRETEILLTKEGEFFNAGVPVSHPEIAAAFARWIERSPAGRYVLRNDLHYVYLRCEDAPLHAERVLDEGQAKLVLQLRGGEHEVLRPQSLRVSREGALYASARDGTWPVRLLAQAALDLEPYLHEADSGEVWLEVGGTRTPIPEVEDPLS